MTFFVGGLPKVVNAEEAYTILKESAERQLCEQIGGRRIYSIAYMRDGKRRQAAVGRPMGKEGVVSAIFESAGGFLISTMEKSGKVANEPVCIRDGEAESVILFDGETAREDASAWNIGQWWSMVKGLIAPAN
jgi:hypothetical protein